MKSDAFRALVGHNKVVFKTHGLLRGGRVGFESALADKIALKFGSICKTPLHAALINGIIGALGFACSAIDALVGNRDGHS